MNSAIVNDDGDYVICYRFFVARNGSVNASVEESVIASVFIYFNPPVTVSEGLADLRSAVRNGTIGPYAVTDLKVIEVFAVENPTFTSVVSNTASTNAPVTRRKNITSSSKGEIKILTFKYVTCI